MALAVIGFIIKFYDEFRLKIGTGVFANKKDSLGIYSTYWK